ncbi:hypothetical protein HW115_03650 [Verrucomicrobiaceae bacterium N1E253]|uniref:Uncharacterized protein n=1 Tax=Oceaniferula marina TaxID=2748318 RepID=A0A851GFX4_9BACT|nr:hypothetical protein [Oceaniferula marina]NWK54691.1 hypothetical protein [Oceaniferula marina]
MAIPLKTSQVICFYDIQYRWIKRSTERGVEVRVELCEHPQGQMLITQCPRVFRDSMVEDIIEQGRDLGWQPEEKKAAMLTRLTKRGLVVIEDAADQ